MRLDLVHLLRVLRRSPVSAGAAVLTLSLTLGAGASIFAVVDAVLLTPPPFASPERLVTLGEVPIDEPAAVPRKVSYATYEAWRERAGLLAALEAFDGTNLTLTGIGAAERVSATDVTPGFLTLLGATPVRGRTFSPGDAGQRVAIVSGGFWRRRLGADPDAVGRQLVLGGQAHTIVGVLPDDFLFALNACDVWRPLPLTQASRAGYLVQVVARLNRDASAADLSAALDQVSRTSSRPAGVTANRISTAIAGDRTRTLGLLAGAAAIAVLIAFANLAGLLMVRSIDRRRELAVRSALGARRSEIARQLLLEAGALVLLGTAGGVLLAWWMTPAVARLALDRSGAVVGQVTMDWRAVGAMVALAFACAWACVSLPALAAARSTLDVLRRGATPSARELIARRVFVVGEVALAFVLLVSLTLLGRNLLGILGVNPGFEAQGVLTLQVSLPAASYASTDRIASFYSALQRALQERLGAGAVSIVDELPLTGDRGRSVVATTAADSAREAVVRTAAPGYFDVMKIILVAGRTFGAADGATAAPRVVVSESLAKALFPGAQPIGRRVSLAATAQTAEIVGVVGDVKHRALDEPPLPAVYLSALQSPSRSSIVVVRSASPDADVIATVREEVARLDRELPVYGSRPMRDVVARSPGVPARRLLTAAFMGFGLLAVLLSTIGLFGVAAHDVARRRGELAIRIALGADRRRILAAALGRGASMVGSGLALGGILSIWATRGLSGLLFITGRFDLLSIVLAAVVLIVASAGAVLPSALRAAGTDPLLALRAE